MRVKSIRRREVETTRTRPVVFRWLVLLTLPLIADGCGSAVANIGWEGTAGTVLLGGAPGHEIEQVYYLGVFDPRDQVPPTVYRVTVRGQAAEFSNMRFGSGWVPASLIDSLNTQVGTDPETGRVKITTGPGEPLASIETGRRLMLFGPEGFREAPKDHRLVIVMGADPSKFFQAIDTALGTITKVQVEQSNSTASTDLLAAYTKLEAERKQIDILTKDVAADLPNNGAKP